MEVDTNELLHRIGAVLRVISKKMDRLVEAASDHFAGADKMVADEPPKKWRILGVGEEVQEGDRVKAKAIPPSDPPNGLGWCRADPSVGTSVFEDDFCIFARPVADEPAKEWRILEPGEVVCSSDWICARSNLPSDPPNGLGWKPQIFSTGNSVSKHDECIFARPVADEPAKKWRILHPGESVRLSDWENEDLNSETDPPDGPGWRPASMWKNGRSVLRDDKCIYARPVADEPAKEPEPAKPAEPEYREPVLPGDCGKPCEFSDDSISWEEGVLIGWRANFNTFNWKSERDSHRYARIKKES